MMDLGSGGFLAVLLGVLLYLAIPAAILSWAIQVLWTLRGIRAALEDLAYPSEPESG